MKKGLCDYFVTLGSHGIYRIAAAVVAGIATVTLLLIPMPAEAAPHTAPGNKVLWGGQGGYSAGHIREFARQSGKHPAVFNYFIEWKANDPTFHWLGFRLQDALNEGSRAMLSVETSGTGISNAELAEGAGDTFLIRLNALMAEHGQVVYLRPLSEMNNGNNPYSAYDLSGRSRGPAWSTRQFKRAWRRLALIVRGGEVARIDAKLRRLGMPPVRTGAQLLPGATVDLMWVPLSFGNPEIPKNHPRHWWPGKAYVDWVGTTWYSPYRATSAMQRMYNFPLWRGKPFAFAEWGVWGADVPGFVGQFFGFLRSHPRVRMAVYYQSSFLKPEFRLSSHPRSRAALRRAVKWPRLTGVAP
jgi:hypothetical protein